MADHDAGFLDMVRGRLASEGFEVQTFKRGHDLTIALEDSTAKMRLPQVILLAALLPDRNGLELCKKIKQAPGTQSCKVVVVSAIQRRETFAADVKRRFLADEYLALPLDFKKLPEFVLSVSAGRKAPPITETPPPPEPDEPRIDEEFDEPSHAATTVVSPADWDMTDEEELSAPVPEVPVEGTLENILFPELMLSLYQRRATGVLSMWSREEERRIMFQNGIPQEIDTNFIANHSLGRILVEQERITPQQLNEAQAEAVDSGRRLGEVLVEHGWLDSYELFSTLHYQAQRKLLSAFEHREGNYRFSPGDVPLGDSGRIEESILQILLAGVKNYCTLAILEGRIYANRHRPIRKGDVRQARRAGLQLTRGEWEILDLVDGERTLGDVMSRAPLSFVRTFQVLYLFFLFGLVRFRDRDVSFFQLEEPVMVRALAEARQRGEGTPDAVLRGAVSGDGEDEEGGDLLRVLYRLNSIRADGVVTVKTSDATHRVVLKEGQPVQITTDKVARDSLGQFLVERGQLDEETRDAALTEAQSAGRPLGEVLLARGLVTPHELWGGAHGAGREPAHVADNPALGRAPGRPIRGAEDRAGPGDPAQRGPRARPAVGAACPDQPSTCRGRTGAVSKHVGDHAGHHAGPGPAQSRGPRGDTRHRPTQRP
ncbi:MAG: DUF4388 domain-containing protein [Deltaproteobacteria bacterium]|nr:DUF4388 domain-containing protein [Deltaproteobacteria bacterium]